ncbi:alpha-2-macroglobulin-like protein [Plakobranchus ocellatus]|uniref:Alpha-2-macroglobulin-like protein n=1 Tax=Plakobranchus ocellatus TaxID=259542 RepID=A0AAV4BG65_9GAST|nr:alpha-2-macroglobulin-like protein [Plakobranchus ocellatus]
MRVVNHIGQVKFQFIKEEAPVGQLLNLKLNAAPDSFCSIDAVGYGVPQETPAKIFEDFGAFTHYQYGPYAVLYGNEGYCMKQIKRKKGLAVESQEDWQYTSQFVDSLEAFRLSSFLVLTDLRLETRPCRTLQSYFPVSEWERKIPTYKQEERAIFTPIHREYWFWAVIDLWALGELGFLSATQPEAELLFPQAPPDMATSWLANAQCVHQKAGFGMSEATSVNTFQPFFITYNMPYAAARGERLAVRVTVHITLHRVCIPMKLTIDLNEKFEVDNSRDSRETLCVCGGKPYTETYYVTANATGSLPFKPKATTVNKKCLKMDINFGPADMSDESKGQS